MNEVKYLKEYKYINICNFDFNIVIHFDYDNEVLLYSLKYIDNDYGISDYLIEYANCFDEEAINKAIKKFMLIHTGSELDKGIILNDYNEGKVEVIKNGIKLINKNTNQHVEGGLYDYDEDYEVIQNKIKHFIASLPKD